MPAPESILITGASSGIGEALAKLYASAGVTLFLSGRNRERLDTVADACRTTGACVHTQAINVTDRAAMRDWIATSHRTAPLDLVFANAGISGGSGGTMETEEQARRLFAVNFDGVLNTVQPALSTMTVRDSGQIALMSSLAGFLPLPGAPAYAASKAAVRIYGEALCAATARTGVRVSVVCPGFVESRMTASNPFPMPFLMSAERAARIIRHGLTLGRPRIAFPWPTYAMAWLFGAILPPRLTLACLARLPSKPPVEGST